MRTSRPLASTHNAHWIQTEYFSDKSLANLFSTWGRTKTVENICTCIFSSDELLHINSNHIILYPQVNIKFNIFSITECSFHYIEYYETCNMNIWMRISNKQVKIHRRMHASSYNISGLYKSLYLATYFFVINGKLFIYVNFVRNFYIVKCVTHVTFACKIDTFQGQSCQVLPPTCILFSSEIECRASQAGSLV